MSEFADDLTAGRSEAPIKITGRSLVTEEARCRARNSLLAMQWSLSLGDHDAVQSTYLELQQMRADLSPGQVAFQNVFHEALLIMAIGDTLSASDYLGRTLGAMRALRTSVVMEAPQAASLVRAMALWAQLAAASGDEEIAKDWATNVIQLWRDGEQDMRPVVDRMRQIAER